MSNLAIEAMNFALETCMVMAAFLLLTKICGPKQRILLYRCLFATLLIAPLAALYGANHGTLAPAVIELEASASSGLIAPFGPARDGLDPRIYSFSIESAALLLWVAGAMVVLARCAISHVLLSRVFAGALPADDAQESRMRALAARLGVNVPVRMRFSARVSTPCTFGWMRPKILLPISIAAEPLDCAIAHELCHIRAHDAFWMTIGRVVSALYWFNPLAWIAARRHNEEIELVCDAAVTEREIGVDTYVAALIQAASSLMPVRSAAAMMSRRGIVSRVRTLINRTHPLPAPGAIVRAGSMSLMAASMLALSAGQIVSAREPGAMMRFAERIPASGNGLIYIDVPKYVRVDVGESGACWGDSRCVFEHRIGEEVMLYGGVQRDGRLEWSGCAPAGAHQCKVVIAQKPTNVSVRLRR